MHKIKLLTPRVGYGANCYILNSNEEFAVVDPSVDFETACRVCPELYAGVKYVLITHAHFDHILEINSWVSRGAEVIVGAGDAKGLSDPFLNCYWGFLGYNDGYDGAYTAVSEGDVLYLGKSRIEIIECPGHTPGGVSYKIGNDIFCGDTAFSGGGYGRCDLPGGDIEVLEKTLIKLITREASETVFYPGHGEKTTLQELVHYFS